MKHILTLLVAACLLICIFMFSTGRCKTPESIEALVPELADRSEDDDTEQSADEAFARWDGLVYMLEFGNEDIENSMNGPVIKAYRGDYCVDSCVIHGVYNNIMAENGMCRIVTGIDTVRFNLTYMPKILDLRFVSALHEADTLTFYKSFCLNDKSFDCTFSAEIALLPATSPGILRYLDDLMQEDITDFGFDATSKAETNGDIKMMAEHYFNLFRDRYTAEYKEEIDGEDMSRGPAYHYFFSAKPVWESPDKKLVTYQFYNFSYIMGAAHGGMEEYFATFDAETGRRLHVKELISPKGFRKSINLLESGLTTYKQSQMEYEGICQAELDEYYHDMPGSDDYTLREQFEHHLYPIPALTTHGMVFSYQPYEKGSFAEGILHFTIPYRQITPYLKTDITPTQQSTKQTPN